MKANCKTIVAKPAYPAQTMGQTAAAETCLQ